MWYRKSFPEVVPEYPKVVPEAIAGRVTESHDRKWYRKTWPKVVSEAITYGQIRYRHDEFRANHQTDRQTDRRILYQVSWTKYQASLSQMPIPGHTMLWQPSWLWLHHPLKLKNTAPRYGKECFTIENIKCFTIENITLLSSLQRLISWSHPENASQNPGQEINKESAL